MQERCRLCQIPSLGGKRIWANLPIVRKVLPQRTTVPPTLLWGLCQNIHTDLEQMMLGAAHGGRSLRGVQVSAPQDYGANKVCVWWCSTNVPRPIPASLSRALARERAARYRHRRSERTHARVKAKILYSCLSPVKESVSGPQHSSGIVGTDGSEARDEGQLRGSP